MYENPVNVGSIEPSDRNGIFRHFDGRSPGVHRTYKKILAAVRRFGAVGEEFKKTSIHLTNKTAFAGIQTRREFLILTVKSREDIKSDRIFRREQTSPNRWHLEMKLYRPVEVDTELKIWLKRAYDLSG